MTWNGFSYEAFTHVTDAMILLSQSKFETLQIHPVPLRRVIMYGKLSGSIKSELYLQKQIRLLALATQNMLVFNLVLVLWWNYSLITFFAIACRVKCSEKSFKIMMTSEDEKDHWKFFWMQQWFTNLKITNIKTVHQYLTPKSCRIT